MLERCTTIYGLRTHYYADTRKYLYQIDWVWRTVYAVEQFAGLRKLMSMDTKAVTAIDVLLQ